MQNALYNNLWHRALIFCFPIPWSAKWSFECDNMREHFLLKSLLSLKNHLWFLKVLDFFLLLLQILEWTRHFWPNFGPLKWRSSGVLAVNYKSEGGFSETFCSQDKTFHFLFKNISKLFHSARFNKKYQNKVILHTQHSHRLFAGNQPFKKPIK